MKADRVQNLVVAKHMRSFFRRLGPRKWRSAESVAKTYAAHLFDRRKRELIDAKRLSRSPFHIGIGVHDDEFIDVTKRATLVSDTLLASHFKHPKNQYQAVKSWRKSGAYGTVSEFGPQIVVGSVTETANLEILCPDISSLGRWIIDAAPLLKAGLAWYLPTYQLSTWREYGSAYALHGGPGYFGGYPSSAADIHVPSLLDLLIQNGRVVNHADMLPDKGEKSNYIKVVMEIDLPFIDGVGLKEFSEITINEFESYGRFRNFLQSSFTDLDVARNSVQAERDILKIGIEINDEIRGMQAKMAEARRKRAVAVTGAGVGTVAASLIAMYGPALEKILIATGALGAGSIWGLMRYMMQDSPRTLHSDRWYYAWVLSRKSVSRL